MGDHDASGSSMTASSTLRSHLPCLAGKINWEAVHGPLHGPGLLNFTRSLVLIPLPDLSSVLYCTVQGTSSLMGWLHGSKPSLNHASRLLHGSYSLYWCLSLLSQGTSFNWSLSVTGPSSPCLCCALLCTNQASEPLLTASSQTFSTTTTQT